MLIRYATTYTTIQLLKKVLYLLMDKIRRDCACILA